VKILSDPQNHSRSAEEIAQLCIEELDSLRATTHRLAVVGQIRFGPQDDPRTVVLGPFRAPLQIKDAERFQAALERPCTAARDAGRHLAWDYKTGTGKGRFMLAPAFTKPRDAWDFYRGEAPAQVLEEVVAQPIIRDIVPVCLCGLRAQPVCLACGHSHPRYCPLHDPQRAANPCRASAA
jgi:hypothetical protein